MEVEGGMLFSEKVNRKLRLIDNTTESADGNSLGVKSNCSVGSGFGVIVLSMAAFADVDSEVFLRRMRSISLGLSGTNLGIFYIARRIFLGRVTSAWLT